MLKKRLIFTLLFGDGHYNLSRNFTLQRVGNLDWIWENFDFDAITRSIDELIILDVSRNGRDLKAFAKQVRLLGQKCFMPIAAGGGIDSVQTAYRLFDAGADKLVLNSAFFTNPNLVKELTRIFGLQSIIASLDFRLFNDGSRRIFTVNGSVDTGMDIPAAIRHVQSVGAGEIYLTSIECEGIGAGYDMDALKVASEASELPLIASGGAGIPDHLIVACQNTGPQACSTANLFNFIGDGLSEARSIMLERGIDLAHWPKF